MFYITKLKICFLIHCVIIRYYEKNRMELMCETQIPIDVGCLYEIDL